MIEVFFSETAKYNKDNLKVNSNKNSVLIGSHLDIGDISVNINEPERHQSLSRLLDNKKLSKKDLNELSDNQNSEVVKLVDAAEKGKTIRIWKSNAPFSTCGFAFVCNQLENIECEISVICLNNFQVNEENNFVSYNHWGEVDPTEYDSFLAQETKLSETHKKYQAKLWRSLKAENSLLRASVNGQLISVPENFYDHLLFKNFLNNNELTVGELIANVLGEYPIGVSDSWYLYRINQLIKKNKLIVTSSKYSVKLCQKTVKINE